MKREKVYTQQQLDHRADTLNKNRGTPGTNLVNAKVHGNRGKQLNPNQRERAPTAQKMATQPRRIQK